MELLVKPTQKTFEKASKVIKIMDASQNIVPNSKMMSKLAKNIKTVKTPVARFFDSPAQISSYYAEGEYDLVSVFKMAKYESFFFKSIQKKVSLLCKSGFGIHSNNDDVRAYFHSRLTTMQLQTGRSFDNIIKTLATYLITCSNAWLIKVRDPDFEYAESYTVDGKVMEPVVGYFLPHPTTMKPRFKYIKDSKNFSGIRLELNKWIHINRRGILKEFDLEDVIHLTLNKEDGLIFGMPEITPVIDDIRTLRKIEEDIQLLMYRDLFPIIHYKVEKPGMVQHMDGLDELTQARNDMQNIIQDGGIATDSRHEIKYLGSEGKGLDAAPYLKYFQDRVFSGLGVTATDMGIGDQSVSKDSADSMSKIVSDQVKFIQQELSDQIYNTVLTELMLQSPFPVEFIFDEENKPTLRFEEVDVEWKIKKENHEADLFQKGITHIHETRNKMGRKDITDDQLMYTHHGLYQEGIPDPVMINEDAIANKYIQQEGKLAKAQKPPTTTGGPSVKKKKKPTGVKKTKTSKSSAERDQIKSAKSNSNITKSRDSLDKDLSVQESFIKLVDSIGDKPNTDRRISLILATKCVYDEIKENMKDALELGIQDACDSIGVNNTNIQISENIFEPLDKLRDSVVDLMYKDKTATNRASVRVAAANKTEQVRAYNYGVLLAARQNEIKNLEVYSDSVNISEESFSLLGTELDVTKTKLKDLPPYRPNQTLRVRIA